MGSIYEEHKDEDGFLYIAYSGENTFGMWSAQFTCLVWTNFYSNLNCQFCYKICFGSY